MFTFNVMFIMQLNATAEIEALALMPGGAGTGAGAWKVREKLELKLGRAGARKILEEFWVGVGVWTAIS